jgi:hypothetical protein
MLMHVRVTQVPVDLATLVRVVAFIPDPAAVLIPAQEVVLTPDPVAVPILALAVALTPDPVVAFIPDPAAAPIPAQEVVLIPDPVAVHTPDPAGLATPVLAERLMTDGTAPLQIVSEAWRAAFSNRPRREAGEAALRGI